jgi:hypothetical protein
MPAEEPPAGTRTAATVPTGGNAAHENAAKKIWTSAVFWSLLRACAFIGLALAFYAKGHHLAPGTEPSLPVTEPTVTVLANQETLPATVDMSLSAGGGDKQVYELTLTITPSIAVPPTTVVKVWFDGVPAQEGNNAVPVLVSGQHEYLETAAPTLGPDHAPAYKATYKSARQIGENTGGGRIRVAFPDLYDETPGPQYSQRACGGPATSFSGLYAGICASLPPGASNWWAPALQAGKSTLSSGGLADYEYLAGDAPTLLGGNGWTWEGVNGPTLLAASVTAQDAEQSNVFRGGIYLGIAGGAAIAFAAEVLRPVWRKDPP